MFILLDLPSNFSYAAKLNFSGTKDEPRRDPAPAARLCSSWAAVSVVSLSSPDGAGAGAAIANAGDWALGVLLLLQLLLVDVDLSTEKLATFLSTLLDSSGLVGVP